jgi:hypothetical protein
VARTPSGVRATTFPGYPTQRQQMGGGCSQI